MSHLTVENVRGGTVESVHHVSVAVCDAQGNLVAHAGAPERVTFIRSAAKPFEAIPLVEDGAVERLGITTRELALTCASHNSERVHVDLAREFLARIGCAEGDLACGSHRPLWHEFAILAPPDFQFEKLPETPITSNCSGKHTGMLALARHHGWAVAGYHESGYPVQERVRATLTRCGAMADGEMHEGVDGRGVVTFAMPLSKDGAWLRSLRIPYDPSW